MKTLSMQRPLPSIEIRVPARFSLSVQAKDVNCEPWSVFMIPGAPKRWMASFSASTQKSASSVFDIRQANTLRENGSEKLGHGSGGMELLRAA